MNATDKQKRYIQLLASKLGRNIPLHELFGKSKTEASLTIDRLKRKIAQRHHQTQQSAQKAARKEIKQAIHEATEKKTKIRQVNNRPQARYTYTCPRCGSHNQAHITINDAWEPHTIKVCAWCGNTGTASTDWLSQLKERHQRRQWNRQ